MSKAKETAAAPSKHHCIPCQRNYKSLQSLRVHLKKFHNKNSKALTPSTAATSDVLPHMCEFCGYQTRIRCNLVVHKRRHTGEKPFCCEQCGKCFTAQYQLVAHSEVHSDALSRRARHTCEICGVGFLSARALYHHQPLHMRSKHYTCHICSKTYTQAAGYAQHKRCHRSV